MNEKIEGGTPLTNWLLLIIAAALILLAVFGCGSPKEITKTTVVVDSTHIKESDSLRQVIVTMKQRHSKELANVKRAAVKFKEIEKPVIVIDSSCNKDSLTAAIRTLENYIAGLKNKVTILADGSAVYEGQIKNFKSHINVVVKEMNELDEQFRDSLRVWKDERINYEKKLSEKTAVKKKRSLWWLWLIIGFGLGMWFRKKWGGLMKKNISKLSS